MKRTILPHYSRLSVWLTGSDVFRLLQKAKIPMAFLFAIAFFQFANAQCPASLTLSISNLKNASCSSSGSVTIGSNTTAPLTYIIASGPSGAPVNIPQGSSTFNSLPAGNYQMQVYCTANAGVSNTISFSIGDHEPITDFTTKVTSKCGIGTGGTIEITGVSGGTAPLQYSVIKSDDPSYADNLSAYTTNTTFNETEYGTYQVRVKDNCGQFLTKTVQLTAGLPPIKLGMGMDMSKDNSCHSPNWYVKYWPVDPVSGNTVSGGAYYNSGGISVKIYDGGGSCTKGALLASYSNLMGESIAMPKNSSYNYYFEVTAGCNTYSYCDNLYDILRPFISWGWSLNGCGASATMDVYSIEERLYYPIQALISPVYPAGAPYTITLNGPRVFFSLPLGYYDVSLLDDCGQPLPGVPVKRVNDLTEETPAGYVYYNDFDCTNGHITNQEGTLRIGVRIVGNVPDLSHATSVTILSGPSNIGVPGEPSGTISNLYSWQNMIPGDYVIRVYSPCGGPYDVPFSIPLDSRVLKQKIAAIATSYCTVQSGKVEIDAANTAYNGIGAKSYTLVYAATLAPVDVNEPSFNNSATGVFTGLAAGKYKIAMNIGDYCSNTTYQIYSNEVTINAPGAAPKITKAVGVLCEDGGGNVLAGSGNGTVYLELSGGGPVTLEITRQGVPFPATPYLTNAPVAPNVIAISGLDAYQTYEIRATGCFANDLTQVTVGKLDPVNVINALGPCENAPYMLSVPEMAGATYQWTNAAGNVLSNTFSYNFLPYKATDNGEYTCTVQYSDCVKRTAKITLNSAKCNMVLPIKLTSFSVKSKADCVSQLEWASEYSATDKEFVVERSNDGKIFKAIAHVTARENTKKYSWQDIASQTEETYYRLKLVDQDGTFTYSAIGKVKSCQTNSANSFSLAPNPAFQYKEVVLNYQGSKINGHYVITNISGQVVAKGGRTTMGNGVANTINIPLQNLGKGVYIVSLLTEDGKSVGHEKLVIR